MAQNQDNDSEYDGSNFDNSFHSLNDSLDDDTINMSFKGCLSQGKVSSKAVVASDG